MQRVEPKVFLVGETRIVTPGLQAYLKHVGVPNWYYGAPSEAEALVEVMGRLCYRSFAPGLNKNVKKVREGNKAYLDNILNTKHGSVLEHVTVNFIFADVSRVLTHELVRHRIGVAISQESLRYVRLDDLSQWLPSDIREDVWAVNEFRATFQQLEQLQRDMALHFNLDDPNMPFAKKKKITSAMRRLAPIGLATTIGWSANIRAIRWVLEQRTDPAAEEEIRMVFGKVGSLMCELYPNLFSDFSVEMIDGLPWYKPSNRKV